MNLQCAERGASQPKTQRIQLVLTLPGSRSKSTFSCEGPLSNRSPYSPRGTNCSEMFVPVAANVCRGERTARGVRRRIVRLNVTSDNRCGVSSQSRSDPASDPLQNALSVPPGSSRGRPCTGPANCNTPFAHAPLPTIPTDTASKSSQLTSTSCDSFLNSSSDSNFAF